MLADLRPLGDLLPENIADTDLRECEARRKSASARHRANKRAAEENVRG